MRIIAVIGLLMLGACVDIKIDKAPEVLVFSTKIKNKLYYSGYHVPEDRKRIVVIDRGLTRDLLEKSQMCKDISQIALNDKPLVNQHGVTVTSIIATNMSTSKYCITMIKSDLNIKVGLVAEYRVVNKLPNVALVNMSYRGPKFNYLEYLEIVKAIEKKVTFIAAAGNESANIDQACVIYPACYARLLERKESSGHFNANYYRSRFKVIGAIAEYTNYGAIVDAYLDGGLMGIPPKQGTSMATALFTGLSAR